MKIKSIETFTTKQIGIVRVNLEDGTCGYGQMAPFYADISSIVLHRQVAPYALGREVESIEEFTTQIIESQYKFKGSYICRAVAGLDTALWDIRGKKENKSVCELLGGKLGSVDIYGSSMKREITPEEETDRLVRLIDEKGISAFKLHICKPCGHNQDIWPGRTEAIVPMVRKAIGDNVDLYVDSNGCYSPERAIEMGRMFQDYGVGFFEEPCPFWEIEQTAQVKSALAMPIAGGEQDNCLAQWKRIIDINAVDIAQTDICYIGGISRALRVAAMADQAGILCTPHCANLSMLALFSLHMMKAIPNSSKYMELTIEDDPWAKNIYYPNLVVQDGKVSIPQGPGWGVTINEEWLNKADYCISQI